MTSGIRRFVLLVEVLIAVIGMPAQAQGVVKVVPDFTVFVDPPTGFVFVKLPAGWKFVGKVDTLAVSRLPASVVTALVSPDSDLDPPDTAANVQPAPALKMRR